MSSPWKTIGNEWFDYEHIYKQIVDAATNGGKIVEVGCWKGASTMFLAMEAKKKNISVFAVDTWLGSDEHRDIREVREKRLFSVFTENMKPIIDDILILRVPSVAASRIFDDNSVDAVFLDADHLYASVGQDILCWLPKVGEGGILAGHDYVQKHSGVIAAVDELIPNPQIIDCGGGSRSWLYTK